MNGKLASENTLGGKAKSFRWRIDKECNIHIYRDFDTKKGPKKDYRKISSPDLGAVVDYVSTYKWHDLANNVATIKNGIEKEGIGRFLHDNLGWLPGDCQLASHLGAIFFKSGVWDYNGKKKGIKFKGKGTGWCKAVTKYYLKTNTVN